MTLRRAYPVMAAIFLSFLVVGMALPALPLHIHRRLGYGPFMVGIVSGCQFAAALFSRFWAGWLADSRGPRDAVIFGLLIGCCGGASYLGSLFLLERPAVSVAVLIIGRMMLGASESLVITGGLLWGIGLVTPSNAARVIAWVGMSMFAAMAVGAPIGSVVFAEWSFLGIAIGATIVPLVALAAIMPLEAIVPSVVPKRTVGPVLRAVLLPGVAFALSGITFGAMTAFLTLHFAFHKWANGAFAFAAFAASLIVVRLFCGHLPDRFGGAQVALASLGVQASGLLIIAFADTGASALYGSAIVGAGFSLVFPSLGIEALRRAPRASSGTAMGLYTAFLDLTLGAGSPALGWLGGRFGIAAVFFASAIGAIFAFPLVVLLMRRPPKQMPSFNNIL